VAVISSLSALAPPGALAATDCAAAAAAAVAGAAAAARLRARLAGAVEVLAVSAALLLAAWAPALARSPFLTLAPAAVLPLFLLAAALDGTTPPPIRPLSQPQRLSAPPASSARGASPCAPPRTS
jgi:hypothetical protein